MTDKPVNHWRCDAYLPGTHDPISIGDVVQLHPMLTDDKLFAGAFMVVTDVKDWGVCGYVEAMGSSEVYKMRHSGVAYYRAANGTFIPLSGKPYAKAPYTMDLFENSPMRNEDWRQLMQCVKHVSDFIQDYKAEGVSLARTKLTEVFKIIVQAFESGVDTAPKTTPQKAEKPND